MCAGAVSNGPSRIRGACPGCDGKRLLVGRDRDGRAICVDCAGISTIFICATYGHEGKQWYRRTCLSCSLQRRLRTVLDDGTGQVPAKLVPLLDKLTAMANPISGLTWLNKPDVRARLRGLADGSFPLSHDGVDAMPGSQGREFLRELLIDVGLLPGRDKYLAAFERWQTGRLASIDDPAARREIARYLRWRHHKNLTVRSQADQLRAGHTNLARDHTDAAVRFLRFVSDRGIGLGDLDQQHVDAWFATAANPASAVDFIAFAIRSRRCRLLQLPPPKRRFQPGCAPARLAEMTERLLTDEVIPLAERVAGLLVVLLAQPTTRICQLRLDDIGDDGTVLTLGADPVPLPEPLAVLVSRYACERINRATTNTNTTYLFPGRRPNEHITAMQLGNRLRQLGITRAERQGALTHLLQQVPAPIVAKATGYSTATTAIRTTQTGGDWATYAALKQTTTTH